MIRKQLLASVTEALGDRQLVWFGTRGEDVESLTELRQLSAAFSLIGTYRRRSSIVSGSLEDLTGIRPDLDTFDVDARLREPEVAELRAALLRVLGRPSALMTYRPSAFLSAIAFSRSSTCRYLGMFSGHQFAFEHKPWVESGLDSVDKSIPRVPWTYIADSDKTEALRFLREGPVMLRRSRTTGGVGLARLDDPSDLDDLWPEEVEGFVSVAPFYEGAIPLNVSGVVWRNGVTVHPLSLQLIGIDGATTREFGYCGNDFGAAGNLDRSIIDQVEESTRSVGEWLAERGYLGAYGVDFMVVDGMPLFTEVNPRFQGSTHLSGQISVEMDLPCVLLDHVAACLGLPLQPSQLSLWELTKRAPQLAHVVVHSCASGDRTFGAGPLVAEASAALNLVRADVRAAPDVLVEPGGTIARLVVSSIVSATGFELTGAMRGVVCSFADSTEKQAV